jgi:hypothetical protein
MKLRVVAVTAHFDCRVKREPVTMCGPVFRRFPMRTALVGIVAASLVGLTLPAFAQQSVTPAGAVARCRNGWYVFVSTGDRTCQDAGGVAEWLSQTPPTTNGSGSASGIEGFTPDQVRAALGSPSRFDNKSPWITWYYDRPQGTETVFFVLGKATRRFPGLERAPVSAPVNPTPKASIRETAPIRDPRCRVYFHVAGVIGDQVAWNRVSPNMEKWWSGDGVRQFSSLCYTSDPRRADYVIVWLDTVARIPYSFRMPVPQTTDSSGTVNVIGSDGSFTTGTYSGTSTTTSMQTYTGTRTQWDVVTAVVRADDFGTVLHSSTKQQAPGLLGTLLSKPDRAALQDAVEFIAQQPGH